MSEKEKAPMNEWKSIEEANSLISTVELKGKQYAEVKERVIAFRRVHPLGSIITEAKFTDNYVLFEAQVIDDNMVLAKGHARERLNSEFAIEKAETSAIGRALGFCGFGITTSIASAEDMEDVGKSEIFDEEPVSELASKLLGLLTKQEYADLLNVTHKVALTDLPSNLLKAMIQFKNEKHY